MKKILAMLFTLSFLLGIACAACAETDKLSVAIVISGATGDNGFYDSANSGLTMLKEAGLTDGMLIECKNDESMFTSNLVAAAKDNDIVVAVGWEFWDPLTEVAPEFADTKFIFIDNGMTDVENVMSITYAQNQGSFLVGYIAGKLTQTNVIGAIGGEDSETINDFLVGYEAGAKYANADVAVQIKYTNSYDDAGLGKEMALALYDGGCDIIFQVADKAGIGAFEAAEERGLYAIGVDTDQKYMNPERIICSMKKEVGLSIFSAVVDYLENGTWLGGQNWVADLTTGLVDVGYGTEEMPQQVSDELKAEVENIRAKINTGEIEVPTTF